MVGNLDAGQSSDHVDATSPVHEQSRWSVSSPEELQSKWSSPESDFSSVMPEAFDDSFVRTSRDFAASAIGNDDSKSLPPLPPASTAVPLEEHYLATELQRDVGVHEFQPFDTARAPLLVASQLGDPGSATRLDLHSSNVGRSKTQGRSRTPGSTLTGHKDLPPAPINRAKTLLNRFGTLNSPRRWHFGQYERLDDIPLVSSNTQPSRATSKRRSNAVGPGVDLSSMSGDVALQGLRRSLHDFEQGPITDDNVQEAAGHLTGGLGYGMNQITFTLPTNVDPALLTPSRSKTLRRSIRKSIVEPQGIDLHLEELTEEAAKRNEIIAVKEAHRVETDLSNMEGGNPIGRTGTGLGDHGSGNHNSSYYFPPDPQMPNWRPFPMRPWYIVLLIVIALLLAAVQEYLCQLSQKLSKTDQGGLIRFINAKDVKTIDFFAFKYLPTIVLVTYGILWQTVDFEVKRLEPFYQLSRPTGATAAESLNMDYLVFFSYLVPFKAIRYRQWAVTSSSLGTVLASALVPVFQSAALNIEPNRSERVPGQPKFVVMDPVWSRLMEATLFIVALSGLSLLFQLRRKSGLLSNPQGIAGVAAMATRSHILNDFRDLDMADHNTIHKHLEHRRYILHKSSLWQGAYLRHGDKRDHESRSVNNPHPLMLQLKAGIAYGLFITAFFIFVPIIMFTSANVITDKLPWLLTAIATIIKMLWSTLESSIRMIEPFYVLSKRHAPPRTLTLDYLGTVPGWIIIKAFFNRHYVVALVGVGAILTEVLTVCVSSFNVDGKAFVGAMPSDESHMSREILSNDDRLDTAETFNSFWTSFSLVLIVLIALSLIASLVYARRRHAFLPRQPSTLASILAYIAQSPMLLDFISPETDEYSKIGRIRVEELSASAMTRHLESLKKTYGLGWIRGRDGNIHLGIDEEEIVAPYIHGSDYRHGHINLAEIGRWEHL